LTRDEKLKYFNFSLGAKMAWISEARRIRDFMTRFGSHQKRVWNARTANRARKSRAKVLMGTRLYGFGFYESWAY
jgi:hypothetical protein